LTPAAFATLSALCERLLPRDDQPGALDLGVPEYIDRAIAAPDLAPVRALVERLLPVLERETRERFHGAGFHDATVEQQDAMILAWQRGHERTRPFFDAVLSLTLEGAFGDPKYGGNKGGEGYVLVGFVPGPPLHKMVGMNHGN
jgi:gluconate 2-dehydrogenase gamma chain